MRGENLFQSSRYKSFVSDRDKDLEQVHQNAQTDISRLLFNALDFIELHIARLSLTQDLTLYAIDRLSQSVDQYVVVTLSGLLGTFYTRIRNMRKAVFILTYASEMEAIARATSKAHVLMSNRTTFYTQLRKAMDAPMLTGGSLEKRIWLDLMTLRSDILSKFRLALVQELTPKEILTKVKSSFPKIVSYKRPPRVLKPIREADSPFDDDEDKKQEMIDLGFIQEGDWDLAVQAYKDTELPPSRFDNDPSIDPESGFATYNWELEQDLMNDFVKQARDGQIGAANDLGIQDFVWVAVLDDRTDKCCSVRNGKTTQEIEDALASGKINVEECDAVTPPAHMNCRCQLAPVASIDQVEGPNWSDFNDWLDS